MEGHRPKSGQTSKGKQRNPIGYMFKFGRLMGRPLQACEQYAKEHGFIGKT
jgi:hypothetical protein